MSSIHQLIAAEALAQAALDLFPGSLLVHLQMDTAGFCYHIAFSQPVDSQALPFFEENMREFLRQELPVQVLEMMRENAADLLQYHKQPIKADQIHDSLYNIVQIIKIGTFYDYVPLTDVDLPKNLHTGYTEAVKILSIEESNSFDHFDTYKILSISGTAAENKQVLKPLVKKHEIAKTLNPLLLGQQMEIFSFYPKLGSAGMVWKNKGIFLKNALCEIWKKNSEVQSFQFVKTPPLIPSDFLDSTSLYKDSSPTFFLKDKEYAFVQDKTPLLAYYYSQQSYSPADFPVRLAEDSNKFERTSWWNEPPAPYDQTVGHRQIYCTHKQIQKEIISSLQFFVKAVTILGFRYEWVLLSSDGKSYRSQQDWAQSLDHLKTALSSCGYSYSEEKAKFILSGPRIELKVRDILKRGWTFSTLEINLAFTQYLKQNLGYEKQRPFLLCEGLFVSLERVIILLLQNNEGMLPWWLAPEQIRVLPIGTQQMCYANQVANLLKENKFRVGIHLKDESLGQKIHQTEKEKIPYQVIVGEKEAKENKITIRSCGQKALKKTLSIEAFIQDYLRTQEAESVNISLS